MPLASQLLPLPGLSSWSLAPSLLFFSQSLLCDLTQDTQATDGRLLRWLPRGELGSAGEDVGSESRFSPHACGWAFWDSSLAVMADRLEWGGGAQRGPVQYKLLCPGQFYYKVGVVTPGFFLCRYFVAATHVFAVIHGNVPIDDECCGHGE